MSGAASPPDAALATVLPTTCRDKDGRSFIIRLFQTSDRADLDEFYDEFEPKRGAQGLPPIGTDRIARWLDAVLPTGVHFLARVNGSLVGHGILVPTGREGIWEWAIFLATAHRGRGLGTEMNRLAVAVGRAIGLRRLWLSVEPHNRAAVRSYENAGFRFTFTAFLSPEVEMELDYGDVASQS